MTIQSIFNAALDIADTAARTAFLDKECAGDPLLRHRVEALLNAHFRDENFLEAGPAQQPTVAESTSPYVPPLGVQSVIAGKYKIREKLGEGGMGTVYVVETIQNVKTFFALKLIKPGVNSRQVLARFEQERQALAMMNHPNIAKFIDAGITETGQPFFVMELIKGLPITKFCDQEKLTVEERLNLFKPICKAVQHAHQKGIIHRDLKPGNILVAIYDGVPVPKVIDFGVAKATLQPLTDQSIYSEIGSMIGTLEYMAPEQAEVNSLDIDTRADLYSLGVILYELMTGTVPFSREELSAAAMVHLLELLKKEEPQKPSTKISGSGSLPSVAASRKIEPAALARKLKGELDWIVMKCLEKERGHRYDGPNQLAQDIEHYLTDQPLIAGPHSRAYRVKKFLKRHKGEVLAASVLLLSLVGGIIGTTYGMVKAVRAEKVAEVEAATAKAINLFLENGILKQADPGVQAESGILVDQDIKLREAVNRAGKLLLEDKLKEQPQVKAALHQTIGKTLVTLGDYKLARPHLEKAIEIRRAEFSPEHPLLLQSQLDLVKEQLEAEENVAAQKLCEETLERIKRQVPEQDPLALSAQRLLAVSYQQQNKFEENRKLWQELVALCEKQYGNDHLETARCRAGLATAMGLVGIKHNDQAVLLEAEKHYEQSLAALKKLLSVQHPDYLNLLNSYAVFTSRKGNLIKAEQVYNELIQHYATVLDAEHNSLLIGKQNLATVYFKQKRLDEARQVLQDVYTRYLKRYGPDYDGALAARTGIAGILFTKGDYAGAETIYRDSLALIERKKGPQDHDSNRYANQLAETLYRQNKLEEAEKYFERVLQTNSEVKPPSEVNLYENRLNLIKVRQKRNKHQECLELFAQNVNSSQYSKLPTIRQAVLHSMYAESLLETNQKEKAQAEVNTSSALFEKDKKANPQEYLPGKDRTKALEQLETIRRKLSGKRLP